MQPVDSAAYVRMKVSASNNTISTVLGALGGGLLGYSVGSVVVGGDVSLPVAAVGALLAGISIPINNKARRQASEALEIYNSKVSHKPSMKRQLEVLASATAIGVRVHL